MKRRISLSTSWRQRPAISLYIVGMNGSYDAFVSGQRMVGCYKIRLGVNERGLERLSDTLHTRMEELGNDLEAVRTEWKDRNGPLWSLASAGEHAFRQIFPDAPVRQLIEGHLQRGATIEVVSEDFLFPWELLYSPLRGRHGILNFWGMRCIVSRLPLTQSHQDGTWAQRTEGRLIIDSPRPTLGLVVHEGLESVVSTEIPTFLQLDRSGRIQLSRLEALLNANGRRSVESFSRFIEFDRDLLHLACHAHPDEPATKDGPATETRLEVSEDAEIKLTDFDTAASRVGRSAFVMLNACRTGAMDPASVFNWATMFLSKGASGVLATEFKVLDDFAAQFAARFYELFLSGVPVGEAVLKTRLHFWRKSRNPLGLGYSLYSSPDVRIQKQE